MDKEKVFNKIIERAGELYGTQHRTDWNHNIRSGQIRALLWALLESFPEIVKDHQEIAETTQKY